MPYARLTTPFPAKHEFERLREGFVYFLAPGNDEKNPYAITVLRKDSYGRYDTSTWYLDLEDAAHFEIMEEEEGEELFDAQTKALRSELRNLNSTIADAIGESTLPAIMSGGSDDHAFLTCEPDGPAQAEEREEQPGTTLITTGGNRAQAGAIRNSLHGYRKQLTALGDRADSINAEIKVRMESKIALFNEQVTGITRFVKKLEGAIHTVNLYLGRAEEITVIRTGAKAPESEPIRIRQTVLNMDEEMAIACPDGIDFKQIPDFDAWLLDPANLHAILPDPKGIVVLRPTLRARKYSDNEIVNALINKENFKTYWLLRNGENLYRIHAEIEIGGLLFPRTGDIEKFFSGGGTPARPGSDEYYRQMDKADEKSLHTLQITLMLQGLLDRTLVFAPFPGGMRPNLMDPHSYGRTVELVRDAEGTLHDGKPTFDQWIKQTNTKLAPGDRIVGTFRHHPEGREEGDRVTPNRAKGFNTEAIRTVVTGSKGNLKFLFERTDEVWKETRRGGGFVKASTRGSYRIHRTDKFFLNFDSITLEEIDYYIHSRASRSSYYEMMATLQAARRLKIEEAAAEAPFIALLEKHLASMEDPALPATPELVAEIIMWWKVKAKDRRPLLADETKAFTMIVSEYRRLAAQIRTVPPAQVHALVSNLSTEPGVLRIQRELNGSVTVIRRANENFHFVHTSNFRFTSTGGITEGTKPREWTHMPAFTSRAVSILHDHPDSAKFSTKPHPACIPGNLIGEALKAAIEYTPKIREHCLTAYLGTTINRDFITIHHAVLNSNYHGEKQALSIVARMLSRNHDGSFTVSHYSDHEGTFDFHGTRPHIGTYLDVTGIAIPGCTIGTPKEHYHGRKPEEYKTLHRYPQGFDTLGKWAREHGATVRRKDARHKAVRAFVDRIGNTLHSHWEAREIALYTDQGGDMEYWPDHLKTIPPFTLMKNGDLCSQLHTAAAAISMQHGNDHLRDLRTLRETFAAIATVTEANYPEKYHGFKEDIPAILKSIRAKLTDYIDLPLTTEP